MNKEKVDPYSKGMKQTQDDNAAYAYPVITDGLDADFPIRGWHTGPEIAPYAICKRGESGT